MKLFRWVGWEFLWILASEAFCLNGRDEPRQNASAARVVGCKSRDTYVLSPVDTGNPVAVGQAG